SPPIWTMSSARSVSSAVMPLAANASLSPISWVVMDLTLTTSDRPVARTSSTTMRFASWASAALSPPASERIFDELRRRILQRTSLPGQRLAIRELANDFGTSITPVRDALQMLASVHLVQMTPRGGSRIAELTTRDIRDLYQVR